MERRLQRSKTLYNKRKDSTASMPQLAGPRSSNVKVVGRFRPLVDFEMVLLYLGIFRQPRSDHLY